MAKLAWDQVGERLFQAGVSKCVLYGEDGYGIPWNGVTSIVDDDNNEASPVYFDGEKFNDIITLGDYTGTLKAFTFPEEFSYYQGVLEDQTGFYMFNQPLSRFSLSFQTEIGNDVDGLDYGYKIHLLYNLVAMPAEREHKTLSLDVEPVEFEWTLSGIPEEIEYFRPTSHVVFDSTRIDPYLLIDLEEILYGGTDNDAYLPSLKGLATFIRKWDRLVITDHGDGTWTAYSPLPDVITMLEPDLFQIVSDTANYIDAYSYTIESSEKNEDDIWLP